MLVLSEAVLVLSEAVLVLSAAVLVLSAAVLVLSEAVLNEVMLVIDRLLDRESSSFRADPITSTSTSTANAEHRPTG